MTGIVAERIGESRTALVEVFRNPNLRRLNLALAGSEIGDWAYAVAVSVYAYREGGATAVGLYGVARYVSMSLAAPFISVLADRFDRKRVMLLADALRFALVFAAGLVIAVDGPAYAVYALGIGTSLAATAFRPAQMAMLPHLATHPGELTAANAASNTIESIAFFAGPAAAGALLAVTDVEVVFGFNAATFLWSMALVRYIRPQDDPAAAQEDADLGPAEAVEAAAAEGVGLIASAGAGFRTILASRELTVLMGLYCAQTLVAGASLVFSVAVAFELLEMSEAGVGLLDAMVGVGGLLGGFVALMLATRGRLAFDFGLGVILWSAPLLLVVAVPELATVLLVMALLGLGNSLVDVNAFTIMQRLVPDDVMGRVFGAVESALIAGMAAGSLAMPLLIETVGLRRGLLVIGLVVGALSLASLGTLRRIDKVALAPDGIDTIRAAEVFAPLPERAVERLAHAAQLVTVAAGEVVFHQGDAGDRFYVVESGEAEVVVDDDLRTRVGPGGGFGEIALLRDVPRQATVRACTDLTLRAIDRSTFLRVVTGHREAEAQADRAIARMLVGD